VRTREISGIQHRIFHSQIFEMAPYTSMRRVPFREWSTEEQYKSFDTFRFGEVDEGRHRLVRLIHYWIDNVCAIDIGISLEWILIGPFIEEVESNTFARERLWRTA